MDSNIHRVELQRIAHRAMIERGLEPDFPADVVAGINDLSSSAMNHQKAVKDLCHLLWCSIDNEESRDLDQLTYAEKLPGNIVRLLVAISDVDSLVDASSPADRHAGQNTTTVYTIAQIFPMLPEKLSTDLTSLGFDVDRNAIVIEMEVDEQGVIQQSDVYCARVRNHAKLAYDSVAAWLDEKGPIPHEIQIVEGLAENLILQDQVAQKMKELRYEHGALEFERIEARPVFEKDTLLEMKGEVKNRAKSLIEDFMIASNGITARFLDARKYPSLRRVVRNPKRWDRIVQLASEHGYSLPENADSKSLSLYLKFVKQNDPTHFTDVSISVLKLLGAGEYVVETPGSVSQGHFGLAVKDYAHSTAPNRRFPDLVTQRLLKSAMKGEKTPYSLEQLEEIAQHCTLKEDDARKVERQVEKSANAMLLESRIGEEFEAIVSGAASKGTWIRLFQPHVEGKLIHGFQGLEVGHKINVRLTDVNVEAGFIDFERVN